MKASTTRFAFQPLARIGSTRVGDVTTITNHHVHEENFLGRSRLPSPLMTAFISGGFDDLQLLHSGMMKDCSMIDREISRNHVTP